MNLSFCQIKHGTEEYQTTIDLRDRVLRQPLGLEFTQEQLDAEHTDYHLTAWQDDQLVGCLILTPGEQGRIKMRQVAIDPDWQGKGVGKQLVQYSEQFAKEKGFTTMYCHARDLAVPFYEKLGYHTVGEPFVEVTITHFVMQKSI